MSTCLSVYSEKNRLLLLEYVYKINVSDINKWKTKPEAYHPYVTALIKISNASLEQSAGDDS